MINAKQSRKWLKYFVLAPETTWYLALILVSLPVSSAIRELRVHSIWSMCHGVGLLNLSRSTVLTPPAKLLLPAQFLAWRCMLANWLKTIQHIQNLKQQNSENSVMKYIYIYKLMKCNESGTQKHLKTSQDSPGSGLAQHSWPGSPAPTSGSATQSLGPCGEPQLGKEFPKNMIMWLYVAQCV